MYAIHVINYKTSSPSDEEEGHELILQNFDRENRRLSLDCRMKKKKTLNSMETPLTSEPLRYKAFQLSCS